MANIHPPKELKLIMGTVNITSLEDQSDLTVNRWREFPQNGGKLELYFVLFTNREVIIAENSLAVVCSHRYHRMIGIVCFAVW